MESLKGDADFLILRGLGGQFFSFKNSRAIDYCRTTQSEYRKDMMIRKIRILIATPLYLLAGFILLVSLKVFPADLRKDARDSFL